ncbi:MAG: hypothetical protein R6X34_08765 [Chloroflexota bacterium]
MATGPLLDVYHFAQANQIGGKCGQGGMAVSAIELIDVLAAGWQAASRRIRPPIEYAIWR